MELGGN